MSENMFYRELNLEDRRINKDKRTIDLTFSSEDPYLRFFGYEILGHKPKEVRMDRINKAGALLADHNYEKQLGKVENAKIKGKYGHASVRFSKRALAEEYFQDVLDEIKESVSVGYRLHKLAKLDDDADDGEEVYRAVDWEPYEISIVSVPADFTVGIGKSIEDLKNIEIIRGKKCENYLDNYSIKTMVQEVEEDLLRLLL